MNSSTSFLKVSFPLRSQRIIIEEDSIRGLRYPEKTSIYKREVGRLLQDAVGECFVELGYRVWVNPNQGNGVDVKVWNRDELIIVKEVLNWGIGSYMSPKRSRNIIRNLSKYSCHKILFYTVGDRINLDWFKGIDKIKLGYQVLPLKYYRHFEKKNQVIKRRLYTQEVVGDIKRLIVDYLKKNILHICIIHESSSMGGCVSGGS